MLGVTFFGLILTPVFYVLVRRFDLWLESRKPEPANAEPAPAPGE
jgi:hypothetical protein